MSDTATTASRPLRIAVAQYAPSVGDPEHNLTAATHWARAAADAGAQLAVLPELATSGYTFTSEAEAERLAEVPGEGPVTSALATICAQSGMHVVIGVDERGAGGARHNSAVVVGPEGVVATYRKLHLFHDEQTWFTPGEDLPVVDLPWGRLGMIVCFDIWFPEPTRALALAGAEVIACPTNWVSSFKRQVYDERGWCQGDYMAVARAAENGAVVACADRIGEERGLRFLGASIIVGADGWPVAGPAAPDTDALLVADVDLASVEAARQRTPRNHLLGDRRASYPTALTAGGETMSSSSAAPAAARSALH
jgi:N-carbamoylputrescine amidase